jgi:uncharacterized alkaline shock family protein YloU
MRSPGKTTVAPDVLLALARLTALKVEGVYAMGGAPRWSRDGKSENGVLVQVTEDRVDLELFLVVEKDVNIRQVAARCKAAWREP